MGSSKVLDWSAVAAHFRDGMTVMFGGFMGIGTPSGLVGALVDANIRDLTLIGNDTGLPGTGVGPLVASGQAVKVIVSHIGTNPLTGRRMIAGDLDVVLVPQGTLAERIRCGGAGLGGVLTPTGVGTVVAEGKTLLAVDGHDYLLELPLRADIAILKARTADRAGNLVYERAARNFNPLMALAADVVIAEVDELVDTGAIDPDHVITPAALVDFLVVARRP